ncbi:MAG: molybdopterin synthase sulfur carrier subunit [Flavobacteriales bacterium CG_4_9_14_3_um_filter_40_17]|nr:MAG: molybdopterin synthase sulfur carrier subunit [Flavobacteriales bacterium CG_4_9_14_3_um_filter_40_17]
MEISILFFGQLAEIIGKPSLSLSNVSNTDDLKAHLQQQFPALEEMTFSIAVNKNIIQQNTHLNAGDEVALLPPFSGG